MSTIAFGVCDVRTSLFAWALLFSLLCVVHYPSLFIALSSEQQQQLRLPMNITIFDPLEKVKVRRFYRNALQLYHSLAVPSIDRSMKGYLVRFDPSWFTDCKITNANDKLRIKDRIVYDDTYQQGTSTFSCFAGTPWSAIGESFVFYDV